jgi:hypothetical protein
VVVTDNHVTLLDEYSPLFPTLAPSPDNICGEVENTTVKICTGNGGSTQCHQQPSLNEILRSVVTKVYPCMKCGEQTIQEHLVPHVFVCLYVVAAFISGYFQCE